MACRPFPSSPPVFRPRPGEIGMRRTKSTRPQHIMGTTLVFTRSIAFRCRSDSRFHLWCRSLRRCWVLQRPLLDAHHEMGVREPLHDR